MCAVKGGMVNVYKEWSLVAPAPSSPAINTHRASNAYAMHPLWPFARFGMSNRGDR